MCSLEPLHRLNKFIEREQKQCERRRTVTLDSSPLLSPLRDIRLVVGRRFRPGTVLAVHLFDADRQSWHTHQVRVNYVIAGSARDWLLGATLLAVHPN